ncbi:hypothetical protein TrVE_jg922 [Triparma verrucosa]|uniref:Choline transporter-like protein n=1 Tax=Triparma verrucosa TaxID=1606542 RepID=A0A9W7F7Y1_9STRA|nr:hypothetical protein TrVE_jg922 [Triparma verrucosa]
MSDTGRDMGHDTDDNETIDKLASKLVTALQGDNNDNNDFASSSPFPNDGEGFDPDSIFVESSDEDDSEDNDDSFMKRELKCITGSSLSTPHHSSNSFDDGSRSNSSSRRPSLSASSPMGMTTPSKIMLSKRRSMIKSPKDVWWSVSFIIFTPFLLFFIPSYASPNFSDNNLLGGPPLPPLLDAAPTLTLFITALVICPLIASSIYSDNSVAGDSSYGEAEGSPRSFSVDITSSPSSLVTSLGYPSLISKVVPFSMVILSLLLTPKWGVFVVAPIVFSWLVLKSVRKFAKCVCPSSHFAADFDAAGGEDQEDDTAYSPEFTSALFDMSLSIMKPPPRSSSSNRRVLSRDIFGSFTRLSHITTVCSFVLFILGLHLGLLPLLRFSDSPGFLPLSAFFVAMYWSCAVLRRIVGVVAACGVYRWFDRQGVRIGRITETNKDDFEEEGFVVKVGNRGYAKVDDSDGDSDSDGDTAASEGDGATLLAEETITDHVIQAVTVSFGSVAKCAFLGGIAQGLWSVTRYLDKIALFRSKRERVGFASGFTTMAISGSPNAAQNKIHNFSKMFVRSYNDYGLAHCAAYCKSYRRASMDVYDLLESSKMDRVLAGDRSTYTCSSACVSVAGTITIVVAGLTMITGRGLATDHQIAAVLLMCYTISYVMTFTTLELLRMGVKAVFVAYAENPAALSQKFPIVFHRFSRKIEETNTGV